VSQIETDSLIGWGLIGVSTIAREHMRAAIDADPRSRPVAVLSHSLRRASDFARENTIANAYDDIDEMLADPNVDVVYVSTRNDLHKEQVLASAAAGKHVLCEKPLALSLMDAVEMRDACLQAGVIMATNHHLRNAATFQSMQQLINSGAIGTPLAARVFHAVSLPPALQTWRVHDPEVGGGVALDITVHDCDALRFLLGAEVVEVTALSAVQGLASNGLEDGLMGVMRLDSGLLASFHDGYTIAHGGTGIEVHGTTGSVLGRDVMSQAPDGDVYLRRGSTVSSVDVGQRASLYEQAVLRFNSAVLGEGFPAVSAEDGLRSLAVALSVRESVRSGRAVAVPAVPAALASEDG